ncbi:MAG: hypothetical protein DRO36_05515 [Candidatus Hecatellales archaeon]|nr:MAG: hypothetical protein DRO36_05515 [Candidatus Hecatellales archaeon]
MGVEKLGEKDPVYEELVNILGDRVSKDPEIRWTYTRDLEGPLTTDLKRLRRLPDYVVLPETTEEVQKIVLIARNYKVPITLESTRISVKGLAVAIRGGIFIDLRRMNRILEIDEENMTATVQPGVTIAQLSCELQKRNMLIPVPGTPATVSVVSNYLGCGWPGGKARMLSIGLGYRSVVGVEMVLPDGTILNTGSKSDVFIGKDFWPHGMGPDLFLLPYKAYGAFGIITKMTVKCTPIEKELKVFWIAYDNIDSAMEAHNRIVRLDLVPNLHLYAGDKYAGYANDTLESHDRMNRAQPEFQIILTLAGTKRQVEYQEKVIRKIAKETGGRIIVDKLPIYQSFIDSHLGMAGSFGAVWSMRYYTSRGGSWTSTPTLPVDKIPDNWKAFSRAILKDPDYGDPNFGRGEFWRSIIVYPVEGGHYVWGVEKGVDLFIQDPKCREMLLRLHKANLEEQAKVGISDPGFIKDWYTGSLGKPFGVHFEVSKKFKKTLDPDNVMQPGYIYP